MSREPALADLRPEGAVWCAAYRLDREPGGSWSGEAVPVDEETDPPPNLVAWLLPDEATAEAALRVLSRPRHAARGCAAWQSAVCAALPEILPLVAFDVIAAGLGDVGVRFGGFSLSFDDTATMRVEVMGMDASMEAPATGPAALLVVVCAAGGRGAAVLLAVSAEVLPPVACGACAGCGSRRVFPI